MRNLYISQPLLSMMHPVKKIWTSVYDYVDSGELWQHMEVQKATVELTKEVSFKVANVMKLMGGIK